jgi:hypothetical protein
MIEFALYEYLKLRWFLHYGEKPTPLDIGLIGASAGGVSAICTTPIGQSPSLLGFGPPS